MTFIFYDTETTGLESAFDQILQFAAIVTDENFAVLEEIDLRCRLQPHVLPSPGAMMTHGVGPSAIQKASQSCYEMTCKIRSLIERWSPAVIVGFNSIGYDEKMLRQAFYQHLHPVYATNTRGNTRMDILVLARAVAAWQPGALSVSVNAKGKPSFKLVDLMEANGLPMGNAHDAHADTRATVDLARHLRSRAPGVWDDMFGCRSKQLVIEKLSREKIFYFTDPGFKKQTILGGVICTSPGNPAVHAVFDLEYDPATYLGVDLEKAKKLLKANPRPVRILRASNSPVIRSWAGENFEGVDQETARARLAQVRNHATFGDILAQAFLEQYGDEEPSEHIEEQIFGGFPCRHDEALMQKFHRSPWEERHAICLAFQDKKYRQFGERLIFAEYPAGLPAETRAALERWCKERHLSEEKCKWVTRASALQELAKLQEENSPGHAQLVAEMHAFFSALGE